MVSQSRTNIKNHFHAAKTEVSHAWRGAIEEADNSGPFKKVSEGLPFPEPPATGTECQRESGQTSFRRLLLDYVVGGTPPQVRLLLPGLAGVTLVCDTGYLALAMNSCVSCCIVFTRELKIDQ